MKGKILNLLLIISSLAGYLEWGGGNHAFLFQAEAEVLSKSLNAPASLLHPLIALPLAGQIMLLITLFQKNPGKTLTYVSAGCIGMLLLFILLVGILSLSYKTILSIIPFAITLVLVIRYHRR